MKKAILTAVIVITSFLHGGNVLAESPVKQGAAPKQEVRIERLTPAYWRITFRHPAIQHLRAGDHPRAKRGDHTTRDGSTGKGCGIR